LVAEFNSALSGVRESNSRTNEISRDRDRICRRHPSGGKTMNTRPYILALWLIPAVLALSLIPLSGARGEGASPAAAAAAPAFNPTFYATQDARVDESNPNTNYGGGDLHVGRSSNANRQTLVQFDLAGLPGNAIVTHATMELYAIVNLAAAAEDTSAAAEDASRGGSYAAGFAPQAYTVYADAIYSAWSESTVTWANKPRAYGKGDPATGLTGAPGWTQFDVTQIVRFWLANPGSNFGILLRGDGSTAGLYVFYSRSSANIPRLIVEYTLPTATPTRTPTGTITVLPTATPTATRTRTATLRQAQGKADFHAHGHADPHSHADRDAADLRPVPRHSNRLCRSRYLHRFRGVIAGLRRRNEVAHRARGTICLPALPRRRRRAP
jgi:hypothetical protein